MVEARRGPRAQGIATLQSCDALRTDFIQRLVVIVATCSSVVSETATMPRQQLFDPALRQRKGANGGIFTAMATSLAQILASWK